MELRFVTPEKKMILYQNPFLNDNNNNYIKFKKPIFFKKNCEVKKKRFSEINCLEIY